MIYFGHYAWTDDQCAPDNDYTWYGLFSKIIAPKYRHYNLCKLCLYPSWSEFTVASNFTGNAGMWKLLWTNQYLSISFHLCVVLSSFWKNNSDREMTIKKLQSKTWFKVINIPWIQWIKKSTLICLPLCFKVIIRGVLTLLEWVNVTISGLFNKKIEPTNKKKKQFP